MGFDVQAFATGFLESRVKDIEKKGDEARAFEEDQRTLADRNVQTVSKRNAVVQQVVGLTNMLRDNGASERVIQAAIAAGPKEVVTLANKVTEARQASGGNKLGSSDIEALVNVPEGFSVMDTDTTDLIRKTYGLGYEGQGVTQEMPERSFMDRLKGDKQMDMARARLDREVIKDGLTAYDVNQMAAQQDYESLVPGTFITFNDLKVFKPSEDMSGFTNTMSRLTKTVQDSDAYSILNEEIKDLIAQSSPNETDQAVREAAKARLVEAQAEMDELYLSTVGSTIQDMADTYGSSFIDSTEGYLRSFLSPAYVDSLAVGAAESTSATTADSQTEAALNEPATATSISVPEVTVTDLPAAGTAEEPVVTEPVVTEPVVEEDPESDSFLDFLDNATTMGSSRENAQTNLDNKARMQENMANVTREEWDDMSRAERREAGLPVRKLDIAFAGSDSFKQEEQEIVKTVKERAAERFGNIDPAQFDAAIEAGKLTELDLQVFADFGDDIMTYLKSNEYDGSEEDVLVGMSTWAQENGKTLPADKSFLVKTFLSAVEG